MKISIIAFAAYQLGLARSQSMSSFAFVKRLYYKSHSALLTCKSKLNKDQDRESYNAKPKLPVTKPLGPAPFLSQKVRTAHNCTRNRIRTMVRLIQPPQTVKEFRPALITPRIVHDRCRFGDFLRVSQVYGRPRATTYFMQLCRSTFPPIGNQEMRCS